VENIPVRYELPVSGVLNGNEESEYKIPLKLEYKSGRKGLLITSYFGVTMPVFSD